MRSGLLVVDKPEGPTSHDIVHQARQVFGTRAVGHAGTLDPMATGVLIVLFEEATKLASYLTNQGKRYRATVAWGRSTGTLDREGETTEERALSTGWLDRARLDAVLALERARSLQVPPQVSALKVAGRRAHDLVREGKSVELAPRPIAVRSLTVVSASDTLLTLELDVSKGYYVRSLARDLGEALGAPSHLSALRRLSSGPFTVDSAVVWEPPHKPEITPLARVAQQCFPTAVLSELGVQKIRFGQALAAKDWTRLETSGKLEAASETAGEDEILACMSEDGRLIALGHADEVGSLRVVRGIHDEKA